MRSFPALLLLVLSWLCSHHLSAAGYTETEENAFGQVDDGDCYAVDKSYQVYTYDQSGTGRECSSILAVYDYYNSACDTGWPRDKYHNIKIQADGCAQSCLVTVDYMNNCNECTINEAGDEITLVDCSNVPGIVSEEGAPQTVRIHLGGGYLKLQYDEDKCLHPSVLEDFVRNGPECRDAPSEFESEGPSMLTSEGPSIIISQGPSVAPSVVASETPSEEDEPMASTCHEHPANGVPENGECYAVDYEVCEYTYRDGCTEWEGTYNYYLYDEYSPEPREDLLTVNIMAAVDCGTDHSKDRFNIQYIMVNEDVCQGTGFAPSIQQISYTKCDNIWVDGKRPFSGRQSVRLIEEGGYLTLSDDFVICPSSVEPSLAPTPAPTQTWAPSQTWVPSQPEETWTPSQTSAPSQPVETFVPSAETFLPTPYVYTIAPGGVIASSLFNREVYGAREEGECYAVDYRTYLTTYIGFCNEIQGTYYYYNTESETGYPRDSYYTVSLSGQFRCDTNYCSVTVGGTKCNSCSISEYGSVTLEDCSNIPGVFAEGRQVLSVTDGGRYFTLGPTEEMCLHPGIHSTVPSSTSVPSLVPSLDAPSITPSTYAPSLVPSQVDSEVASEFPSYCASNSCFDDYDVVQGSDDCYSTDISICSEDFCDGCLRQEALYTYDIPVVDGSTSKRLVSITASYNCLSEQDSCTVRTTEGTCRSCQRGPGDEVTLTDCSNLPGVFPSEAQTILLSEGGGFFKLAENDDFECSNLPPSQALMATGTASEAPSASPTQEALLILSVGTRMTLTLHEGHANEIVDSTDVLMLMEQTESFIRNTLSKDYADQLDSIQLTDIVRDVLAIDDSNKFVLSFTVQVAVKDLVSMLRTRVLAQLLTNGRNLNDFAGNYAPYTDLGEPNGVFQYTSKAHWRVTGNPMISK